MANLWGSLMGLTYVQDEHSPHWGLEIPVPLGAGSPVWPPYLQYSNCAESLTGTGYLDFRTDFGFHSPNPKAQSFSSGEKTLYSLFPAHGPECP